MNKSELFKAAHAIARIYKMRGFYKSNYRVCFSKALKKQHAASRPVSDVIKIGFGVLYIKKMTEKAILVENLCGFRSWLPKSQVELNSDNEGTWIVSVKRWIAEKNDIFRTTAA